MPPTQGITYNRAVVAILPLVFAGGNPTPELHLFVSDSTPGVSDSPPLDYTEASGGGYAPLTLGGSLNKIAENPPLYAVIGAAFLNLGPLAPGHDTVFGWWIDFNVGFPQPTAMYGGRFETPLVINMAHQQLFVDQIQLPMHDCNTIPFYTTMILDPWFQKPPVTGTVPLNWQYNPTGGDWSFPTTTPGNAGGIAGNGSQFGPPFIFPGSFQNAFIQGSGTISQTLFVPAGGYQLDVIAAQRIFGVSQSVRVTLGNTTIGTISSWPTAFQLWESSSFTVTASDTYTLTFRGLVPQPADATLFLYNVALLPFS